VHDDNDCFYSLDGDVEKLENGFRQGYRKRSDFVSWLSNSLPQEGEIFLGIGFV